MERLIVDLANHVDRRKMVPAEVFAPIHDGLTERKWTLGLDINLQLNGASKAWIDGDRYGEGINDRGVRLKSPGVDEFENAGEKSGLGRVGLAETVLDFIAEVDLRMTRDIEADCSDLEL